jgi:hypothetical protein
MRTGRSHHFYANPATIEYEKALYMRKGLCRRRHNRKLKGEVIAELYDLSEKQIGERGKLCSNSSSMNDPSGRFEQLQALNQS